jgi:N-acetylneuraminic acid mutarotase
MTWIDAAGNFWLFGGFGLDSSGSNGFLNDLWKYSAGQWMWVSGSNVTGQKGTYGIQGTNASSNIPGAREGAVTWTDAVGNLWLFGGFGFDSTGTLFSYLNDLWKYGAGQWTWMGGSNVANQKGTYGIQGTAAPNNIPGARIGAMNWIDAGGNIWLFGGTGYESTGILGSINDLWKYSAGQWTWIGGPNTANQSGIYGTQGAAAPGNIPGARATGTTWTDTAGNFWLFGGGGYDSIGTHNRLNDLWRYSAGQWTWMGGSQIVNQNGTYGTQGTVAPGNIPGARGLASGWTDAAGNLWFFGGDDHDLAVPSPEQLNDLWKYEP